MKRAILALAVATLAAPAVAADKTYQVTGPVTDVSGDTITVQKGKESWQLARTADTKVDGADPKKGDKVTVEYTMTAKKIEVKPAKGEKASAKAKK